MRHFARPFALFLIFLWFSPAIGGTEHNCAFILSTLESTSDESPLLIFADYLEENGDPAGEFVRIQVQLNRLRRVSPQDPQIAALQARRQEILTGKKLSDFAVEFSGTHNPYLRPNGEFVPMNIPKGGREVRLGSPASEPGRYEDEALRTVVLTKPFEMQMNPVTQLQWAMVMGRNPSHFTDGGVFKIGGDVIDPHRPVEQVSWNDVQEFIKKLNAMDKHYTYRLPTEAEWEFAARGGRDTAYSFGNDPNELPKYGFFSKNSQGRTQWVRSLLPNDYGLFDVHGNVWEWTQDAYIESPPGTGMLSRLRYPRDPLVQGGEGSNRVMRGGSWWFDDPQHLRSALRDRIFPDLRDFGAGFRLVRTPK